MKKIFLITASSILFANVMTAQSVGINNSAPHSSAILDVKSAVKGMLLPRTSTTSRLAIVNPAKGLMLYDTTSSAFWFYNGTAWGQLVAGNNGWTLTGNAGTDPSSNFIGTTDNQPLRWRVNNIWAGELDPISANVFLGLNSGQSTSSGTGNTGVGGFAMPVNTTGYDNTALGAAALYTNIDGIENTAIGRQSLFYNTNGYGNTATGYKALRNNNNGYSNTATGAWALASNTSATGNTAHGFQALLSNTTGIYNTANGYQALYYNTTGAYNVANGSTALHNNVSGDRNTAIGLGALEINTVGQRNIAIGFYSGTALPFLVNTIGIGNDEGYLLGASNRVIIGNPSTVVIGGKVGWTTFSDARIKNNVKEDVKGLDFILRLRPVTYHISNKAITDLTCSKETPDFPGKYDCEKIKYTGFLAQEVEQAANASGYDFSGYTKPENERGMYSICYAEFVVPLVKAMQEQQLIIATLQKQVEANKAEIPTLIVKQQSIITKQQNQIDLLEKRLTALEIKL